MYQQSFVTAGRSGYTLIELLVVLSIIAILISVVGAVSLGSLSQSRDAQRQADIQIYKTAIEQYKAKYNRYPDMGCTPTTDGWSRQKDCPNFIVGLGEFLPQPPRDPLPDSGDGYVYRTNADGTVYKFMVRGTVEREVTTDHPLQACPQSSASTPFLNCGPACQPTIAIYSSSYAVWGGFANGVDNMTVGAGTRPIICAS